MEPLTLSENGREQLDDGYAYTLNRVPDDVDALGLAKLLGVERERVVLEYEPGTATITAKGLTEDGRGDFENELRAVCIEVNRARGVADRLTRDEGDWTPGDSAADAESEAAVDRSFANLR